MAEYLVGIDLGTSSLKVALTNLAGVTVGACHRDVPIRESGPGRIHQDPEEFLKGSLGCIRDVLEGTGVDTRSVLAIGLSGQMGGIIGIDSSYRAVTPYDLVLDVRSEEYSTFIERACRQTIFRISSGIWSHAQKMLWWKNEGGSVYGRIAKFVPLASYVGGRLAGLKGEHAYLDHTSLFCSGLGDIRNHVWSEQICRELAVDADRLPSITEPWHVVGGLESACASACGLPTGTPIAAGSGDQPAGFLGAGIVDPGMAIDVAGSTSVFSVCTDRHVPDMDNGKVVFMSSILPGQFYPLSYVSGGGVTIRWFRDQLARREGEQTDAESVDANAMLEEEARTVPPGSDCVFFIPHFGGRSCPNQPAVRGGWIGLNWTHRRAHLYRAILESIGYDHYGACTAIRGLFPDLAVREVRVAGGGSRSGVWNQIKADVMGIPYLELDNADPALLGACLVAGRSVGAIMDLASAARGLAREVRRWQPDAERHRWYIDCAQRYEHILGRLGPVWDDITTRTTEGRGR